jgi:hypothetical protein
MATPFPFSAGAVLTAAQMNSIGETAINYTPVVTATTGAITTYTAFGGYQIVNKLMRVWFNINITNNGTGGGAIRMTLPFSCQVRIYGQYVGGCREGAINGYENQCTMESGTTILILTPTNGYPAGTGYQLNGSVLVELA